MEVGKGSGEGGSEPWVDSLYWCLYQVEVEVEVLYESIR